MEHLNHWIGESIKRGAIAVLTHRNGDMDTVGSACALANIIGPNALNVAIGDKVRCVFEARGEGINVPQFLLEKR